MKKPRLLKKLLDFLFYIILIMEIGMVVAFIYSLIFPDQGIPTKFSFSEIDFKEFTYSNLLKLTYLILIGIVFLLSLYFMRKLINNFVQNEIFSPEQTSNLRAIGNLILIFTIAEAIVPSIMEIFMENSFIFSFGIDLSYGSFWFLLILGLLFLCLSHVFENARKIKEENDFTV